MLAAPASARPDTDSTPLTADGKPLVFHLHRARVILQEAYSTERWRDRTPARASEKRRWQAHKRAILHRLTRVQIGEYRDRLVRRFERHREEQLAYSRITPPGPEWLAALRQCESGGNYSTNTGNGFYGAYQFTLSTWASVGGSGYPHLAAPAEQDYRAAVLYRTGGPGHWPNCP